jgi:hypothetical protein
MMDPDQRKRWQVVGFVNNHLAAGGEQFTNDWLALPRPELEGKSASEVLTGDFDPKSRLVNLVMKLAHDASRPPGSSSLRE